MMNVHVECGWIDLFVVFLLFKFSDRQKSIFERPK